MNLILKTFTDQDITHANPCVPTSTYFQQGWSGTAIDVLNMNQIPIIMRLWVIYVVPGLLPLSQYRLMAVFFANQLSPTDQRSIDAITAATNLANGNLYEDDRYIAEYNAALAIEDSPNATETLNRMAAMHCVIANLYSAFLGTADIAATRSDANAQAQIQQAISIFNQYGN